MFSHILQVKSKCFLLQISLQISLPEAHNSSYTRQVTASWSDHKFMINAYFLSFFFFCPCHFCSPKYSVPSNAYHLILLYRASSNTVSLVKSSLLPSTRINTSLFCVARAIYMLFGSFGVHLFTNCILNVSDDHQALSDTGKKRQAFKKFILRNVNLLAQMHVIHAENKHSNGALNQSLGRLSGRGNLTV